jgi:hypothetical protein
MKRLFQLLAYGEAIIRVSRELREGRGQAHFAFYPAAGGRISKQLGHHSPRLHFIRSQPSGHGLLAQLQPHLRAVRLKLLHLE